MLIWKKPLVAAYAGLILAIFGAGISQARGVSPYLPLNLSPAIERKIERVLVLGDKPAMRRPIPAAVVLDALPKACAKDQTLCDEVRQYLDRFMHAAGVTEAKAEVAVTSGQSTRPIPNQHGMPVNSKWSVDASAFYQPSDYLLINAGALAYQGRVSPTGTVISMGTDLMQIDVGFRDHWFSPNSDSSMLMSTEAPTMPSVAVSNYRPMTRFGFNYEIFLARMSTQQGIRYKDTTTQGHPNLAGIQLGIEPADGYALSINRLMQYGGGARGSSTPKQFYKALFSNNAVNRGDSGTDLEFGNQQASVTANAIFPGQIPFAIRIEYAGEDSTYAGIKYLGDTDLTLGIDFPKILNDFDFTYEVSEWQNAWYVHPIYPQGMANDGFVTGHWFGDQRAYPGAIGGHSQSARFGYSFGASSSIQLSYRDLVFNPKWAGANATVVPNHRLHEVGARYTTSVHGRAVAGELLAGRDVDGKSFARIAASFDFSGSDEHSTSAANNDADESTTLFVDVGLLRAHQDQLIYNTATRYGRFTNNFHWGAGARRRISDHGELGVRIDFDELAGHSLISMRAVDYRYQLTKHVAMGGFFGVARYEVGLPAYGWNLGAGLSYVGILKNWDLCFEGVQYAKLSRDAVVQDDIVAPTQPRVFFNIDGFRLMLERKF